MKSNKNIVVIEDDPLVNDTIKTILSGKYENVITFTDAAEGMDKLHTINPDLILLDIFLGYHNGIEILEQLRNEGWKKPVIIMTAFSDVKLAVKAMKLGAKDFIVKPLDLEQLEISVATELRNAENETFIEIMKEGNPFPIIQSSNIIGASDGMQKAMRMAKILANADDTTVLITGESGTGKELMAQYIHNNSKRAKAPFIAINCGSIPKDLAENELFGHEKGAFTGAIDRKIGKFEAADSGTLFLDEIGEMSPNLQAKMLRVLENSAFERIGSNVTITVDVRIITATNRDLEKEVAAGKFRHDLFFRLRVLEIVVPPLRKRPTDIPILAKYFLERFCKETGRKYTGFDSEAMNILMNYRWPGNVRELKNIIERAVVLGSGPLVQEQDLLLSKLNTTGESHLAPPEKQERDLFIPLSLEDLERNHIIRTLEYVSWNKSLASKQLGIERTTLDRKIKRYNIEN